MKPLESSWISMPTKPTWNFWFVLQTIYWYSYCVAIAWQFVIKQIIWEFSKTIKLIGMAYSLDDTHFHSWVASNIMYKRAYVYLYNMYLIYRIQPSCTNMTLAVLLTRFGTCIIGKYVLRVYMVAYRHKSYMFIGYMLFLHRYIPIVSCQKCVYYAVNCTRCHYIVSIIRIRVRSVAANHSISITIKVIYY